MVKYFDETNQVPVDGSYDVIVVGGGVAGIGAALAARRSGLSVLLVEKGVLLGGLATSGLIAYYLPLCDGKGRKVIGGLAEELLHASIKYGYNTLPDTWKKGCSHGATDQRYKTLYSAAGFVLALDELLEDAGVEVLLDTAFCKPVHSNGDCRGIIVENKSGRRGLEAKVFVDATGDADLMFRLGACSEERSSWLSCWYYMTDIERIREAARTGDIRQAVHLASCGVDLAKEPPSSAPKYCGTDPWDITRAVFHGRRLVRQEMKSASTTGRCVLTLPSMAQLRTNRRIRGRYELVEEDVGAHFDDSIGCTGDWRKAGPVFEIPYRSLLAPKIKNVITAGRTIAASGDVWEVTRAIPTAVLTGQAAGTAAYVSILKGCTLPEVPIEILQRQLESAGVFIHAPEQSN